MGNAVKKTFLYCILALLTLTFLFPIIWVMLSAFKKSSELFSWPPSLLPRTPTLDNFIAAINKGDFGRYFYNSAVVSVSSTILAIIINTMAGFAFAKYKFKFRDAIFIGFLATLMLPLEVIMIPIFQVIKRFSMYNSLLGIIIPPAATPTGVFLARQYFLSIPDELLEAARIDGASERRIFVQLILPNAKPLMSVLFIFSFMWRWNDYMWPLLVIRDMDKYTVQLALANFSGQFSVDWSSLLAMAVISMIPMLVVFLIFQKQFVKGMVVSGMKE